MRLFIFATLLFLCACDTDVSAPHDDNQAVTAKVTVNAPINEVWQDWSSADGLESFFAPKAFVELKTYGRFDVWFVPDAEPGQKGAEDGKLLGYQPERMIAFTWAMPPYMQEIRPHYTFVQIWFDELSDNKTQVRLYHYGWGDSDAWTKGRDYFSATWPQVMQSYEKHITETR